MNDGSGLSRYDYVTADAIVLILKHVWNDDTLRGPFVAALPVGGHDGTLEHAHAQHDARRRVQAKTGTISNMRSLSGFVETKSGERSCSRSSRTTSRHQRADRRGGGRGADQARGEVKGT